MKVTHNVRGKGAHYVNCETETGCYSFLTSAGTPVELYTLAAAEREAAQKHLERARILIQAADVLMGIHEEPTP